MSTTLNPMKSKIVGRLSLLLLVLELLLVFVSWLLSATMTEGVRPLLSDEGVRWLCGHFVDIVLSPVLVWILVVSMAVGCLVKSRLPLAFVRRAVYRERIAWRVTWIVFFLYAVIVVLMVVLPQAVLLSSTGQLWPSPFSRAVIPLISFGGILMAVCYGGLSRTFTSLSDVTDSLSWGIAQSAPLLILYILGVQLYQSLLFVFA